ncbi:MAG TPA: TadE/TadG family type IV pilus assembly protein [Roseiflexaceae bacterium]|nr:TadE/TadG family type IV pilus assembly protein [Roseiflexaceae bacterium]
MKQLTDRAQALVEFALASTLILLLLAAAVDLGLVFLNLQGISNAAQEGAQYGSRHLTVDALGIAQLDLDEIRQRVRMEAGATGGIGFVDMQDLNSDRIPDAFVTDSNEPPDGPDAVDDNGDGIFDRFQYGFDADGDGTVDAVTGLLPEGRQPAGYTRLPDLNISDKYPDLFQFGRDTNGDGRLDEFTRLLPASPGEGYVRVIDHYIRVQAIEDVNRDSDPTNDPNGLADDVDSVDTTPCQSLVDPTRSCHVRVVVISDHQTVFPLIDPVWDDKVPLRSAFVMPLRAGFTQAGAPTNTPMQITNTPVTPTNTATNTATATNTVQPGETRTPQLPVPATLTPTPTNTRRPTSTTCPPSVCTPRPTRTPRPTSAVTNTPRPTRAVTNTPRPTNTRPPATQPPPTLRPTRSGS